jgi:lipopolysaccharide transport protein LptA
MSTLHLGALLALVVACASPQHRAAAQSADLEISLDAASSEIDRKNNQLIFNDVEIRQGDLAIRARKAVGTGLSFENSDWTFSQAVTLTNAGAVIEADEAVLSFRAHRLARARLVGAPVTFERDSVQVAGQHASGQADRVDYDLDTGSVRLSGNAWLCESNNEITSDTIVYDIEAERVLADAGDDGDGRVRIVITPPGEGAEGSSRCGPPPGGAARDADGREDRDEDPPTVPAGDSDGDTPVDAPSVPSADPSDDAGPATVPPGTAAGHSTTQRRR